jgi:predicted nucleic acid-binding protein
MPLVISNASPLIGLCQIKRLRLLKDLWSEITIPDAVYKEVVISGSGKPGSGTVEDACQDWIQVLSVKNKSEAFVLQTILDEGESEVITLGQELHADLVVLDNREPRLLAQKVGLKIIGTVGIIKLAWHKGLIKEPVKELHQLQLHGFWIDHTLIDRISREMRS